MLLYGEQIGQYLGGVIQVGQAVPYGYSAVFCQQLNVALLEAPELYAVVEAAKHLGGILKRFLFAHLTVGKECAVCALVIRGDLESAARTGGGLFKKQHYVASGKQIALYSGALFGLKVMRKVKKIAYLLS